MTSAKATDKFIDGWYQLACCQFSPHFNERPCASVDLLVIHNISLPAGQFATGYVQQLFMGTLDCNAHPSFCDLAGLRVSSHFLIDREGEVTQFVAIDKRAWHAGISSYQGREGCNDFSVGIELEGTDTQSYTDEQYSRLAELTQALMQKTAITPDRIVGHCDIAPGRKTDPGSSFDWSRYRKMLGT